MNKVIFEILKNLIIIAMIPNHFNDTIHVDLVTLESYARWIQFFLTSFHLIDIWSSPFWSSPLCYKYHSYYMHKASRTASRFITFAVPATSYSATTPYKLWKGFACLRLGAPKYTHYTIYQMPSKVKGVPRWRPALERFESTVGVKYTSSHCAGAKRLLRGEYCQSSSSH